MVPGFPKTSRSGRSEAQVNLGRLYDEGLGVPQDDAEAVKWFRKAADQGNSAGQVSLGLMCYYGQGIPQDDSEAIRWIRKAADQGNVDAMFCLGSMYANARGVAQDYVQGHMWYNLAASGPSSVWEREQQKEAAEGRDELAAKMTPQQVAEAQRLAREWKPTAPK